MNRFARAALSFVLAIVVCVIITAFLPLSGMNPTTYAASNSAILENELPPVCVSSYSDYFPPFLPQIHDSCAAHSSTYYQYTYMTALARGIDVKSAGKSAMFSTQFTYNLLNKGTTSGVFTEAVYNVLHENGALPLSEFKYDGNYSRWPTEASVWRMALENKSNKPQVFEFPATPEGLLELKRYLAEGYTFTVLVNMENYRRQLIRDNPDSTLDDPEHFRWVFYRTVDNLMLNHQLTISGYNDDILAYLDTRAEVIFAPLDKLNTDEFVLGAFKMGDTIESVIYPADRDWDKTGMWMSYRNFLDGTFPADRKFYTVTARTEKYTPKLLGEFHYSTSMRGSALIKIGYAPKGTDEYDKINFFQPTIFNSFYKGPAYNGTIVLDFSDLIGTDDLNVNQYDFYIEMHELGGNPEALNQIHSFRLTDADGNVLAESGQQFPKGGDRRLSNVTLVRASYGGGYPDEHPEAELISPPGYAKGPFVITWDFNDGSTPIKETYSLMDKLIPPIPPDREGYLFEGWHRENGREYFDGEFEDPEILFAASDMKLIAQWKKLLLAKVDMIQEVITINQSVSGTIYYRVFKGKTSSSEPIPRDAVWKPVKTMLTSNSFSIEKMINPSKPVLIEFCLSTTKPDKKRSADYWCYMMPRPKAPKIKLDGTEGYSALDGYAKLGIDAEDAFCVRSYKGSDPYVKMISIEDGYYLPIDKVKRSYHIKLMPESTLSKALSFSDALIPASKPVKVSVATNRKAPTVKRIDEVLRVKCGMQVSTDGKSWLTVAAGEESEATLEYISDIKGIDLNNPKIIQKPLYIRLAPTAKKPASLVTALRP